MPKYVTLIVIEPITDKDGGQAKNWYYEPTIELRIIEDDD